MKNKIAVTLCVFLLLTCAAYSQDSNQGPATREDVEKMLDALQTKQMMQTIMTQMTAQSKEMARKNLPKASPQELADMDRMMDEFMSDLPMSELVNTMIPIYQKHFTRQDINNIVAFYASPTGKKFITEMPAMMQESMEANMALMQKRMEAIQKKVQERIDEINKSRKPAGNAPKSAKDNPSTDKTR